MKKKNKGQTCILKKVHILIGQIQIIDQMLFMFGLLLLAK